MVLWISKRADSLLFLLGGDKMYRARDSPNRMKIITN